MDLSFHISSLAFYVPFTFLESVLSVAVTLMLSVLGKVLTEVKLLFCPNENRRVRWQSEHTNFLL